MLWIGPYPAPSNPNPINAELSSMVLSNSQRYVRMSPSSLKAGPANLLWPSGGLFRNQIRTSQGAVLLTWFNFNPSMDK